MLLLHSSCNLHSGYAQFKGFITATNYDVATSAETPCHAVVDIG